MKELWKEIEVINSTLKPTKIKEKEYIPVNERIRGFRTIFPDGFIRTEIISMEGGVCVMKAEVGTKELGVLGTGTAYEKESANYINKTSYIENCETSAVGRALGMLGIGIESSVASFDEVDLAIQEQEKEKNGRKPISPGTRQSVLTMADLAGLKLDDILSKPLDELTEEEAGKLLLALKERAQANEGKA